MLFTLGPRELQSTLSYCHEDPGKARDGNSRSLMRVREETSPIHNNEVQETGKMKKLIAMAAISGWLALSGSVLANDAAPIIIPSVVHYSDNAPVPPAVRTECQLEVNLANWIKSYADEMSIPVTVDESQAGNNGGRVLDVRITNVFGAAGGAWSGGKSVQVAGELRENGAVVATFTGSRVSGGGAFGQFKGTCSILGRCVKAIGKDIADWMRNPTPNARLGDG